MSRARLTDNPFYVLGLRPDCSRTELEREGQKLLAMLELGMSAVQSYATPLGPVPRTADAVRQAMAELRDPQRRLMHELWAQLPATAAAAAGGVPSSASQPAQPEVGGATNAARSREVSSSSQPAQPETSDAASAAQSSGAPPPWPEARAALGFGARR